MSDSASTRPATRAGDVTCRRDGVELNRRNLAARTGTASDPAPVRIAHLGLGAFHRAHQAWYTDVADEANEWGIAAFTGRSRQAAEELAAKMGSTRCSSVRPTVTRSR